MITAELRPKLRDAFEAKLDSPQDLMALIRETFRVGDHMGARELSRLAAVQYPHDSELQKAAHILAPPVVRPSKMKANPKFALNSKWINENRLKFRGKSVALHFGKLLYAGDSWHEVVAKIGKENLRGSHILVTTIY